MESQLLVNVVTRQGKVCNKWHSLCLQSLKEWQFLFSSSFYSPCLNPCNIRTESLTNYYLMCVSLLFSSIIIPCQQWLLSTPTYSVPQKESHQWCALSGSNPHISLPKKRDSPSYGCFFRLFLLLSHTRCICLAHDRSAFHGAGLILLPTFP